MIKKIIKFGADFCQPCKVYHKYFEEVKDKFKDITFEEIDCEEDEETSDKYGIKNVPTTIFLDENNNIIYRKSGVITTDELTKIIDEK